MRGNPWVGTPPPDWIQQDMCRQAQPGGPISHWRVPGCGPGPSDRIEFIMANPQPWYRSPWAMGAGVVIGGIAAGALLAGGVRLAQRLGRARADCTEVGSGGGVINGIRYLERIRGGADPNAALPMVLVFHSKGARPEGFAAGFGGIGPARLILPEGPYATQGGGRKWWVEGIKSAVREGNMAEATAQWQHASDQIANFVDQITQCRPTLGKPIITGSSQGGEMTLLVASTEPRRVYKGVAVASYLLEPFWTSRMAPVDMLHGTGDRTVPFSWAKQYAEHMMARGAPLTFTAFSSPGHGVTSQMSRAWIGRLRELVDEVHRGEASGFFQRTAA